jgi:DNA repair exonuclease SbcCD ATPase subunit
MSDELDDSMEKMKDVNPAVRRAMKEGNLELGMNAAEQVNTVLRNLDSYEEGLMKKVENDIEELEDAIDKFRGLVDLEEDELHSIEESEGKWSRVTLYLDFLKDRVEELEQERKREAEEAAAAAEAEEEDSGGVSDVPEELDVDIRKLREGYEPFAAPKDLDLSDYRSDSYGLEGIIQDMGFIVQKSLAPVAGEIEEDENKLYKALKETVDAIEDAAKTHSELLEVKEILNIAEEDDELLEELEEKDVKSQIQEQIERAIEGTGRVEDEFRHLEEREEQLMELIKNAHELIERQVELDEEFLNRVDNELGRKKSFARWLEFRNTGLYRDLRAMEGKSEDLDKEVERIGQEFDNMRKILDEVMKRKQSEEIREEKVLSEVEDYLQEYSSMES